MQRLKAFYATNGVLWGTGDRHWPTLLVHLDQIHRHIASWVGDSTTCLQHKSGDVWFLWIWEIYMNIYENMRKVIRNIPSNTKSLDWGRVRAFSPLPVQGSWYWELSLQGKSRGKDIFPLHSFFLVSAASCSFLLTGEAARAVVQVHLSCDTPIYLSIRESPCDLCVWVAATVSGDAHAWCSLDVESTEQPLCTLFSCPRLGV